MAVPCADFGRNSVLPSILPLKNVQTEKRYDLDEYDEVFSDVGRIPNLMPYPMKSTYDRGENVRLVDTVVLENEYLKATFLPMLGGKLWSLFDKEKSRELLYVNDIIRPCNLALCNAWTSGGVEWNIGMIGHSPFTCEQMNVAVVDWQGQKVLRMYAFERVREAVYQMDFLLPPGSKVLLCRMRIKNTRNQTIPMYWFSNIAVPETPGARVVAPASEAFYSDINGIGKVTIPYDQNGIDVTDPANSHVAADYFYRIPEKRRKYVACVNRDGTGMFQTSTSRQKGRKMFAWGDAQGGRTWQKWLTKNAGDYIEIQAGVNPTQYECIYMPPNAAWEWVEAYGALETDPESIFGDYTQAQKAVEEQIAGCVDEEWLEKWMIESRPLAHVQGQTHVLAGHAVWGKLERMMRNAPMEEHLDFGDAPASNPWRMLLEKQELPMPGRAEDYTYAVSDRWLEQLLKAPQTPYVQYHIGLNYLYRGDERCLACLEKAAETMPHAHYALAVWHYLRGEKCAVPHLLEAEKGLGSYVEFVREMLQMLNDLGAYQEAQSRVQALNETLKKDGHVQYEYARTLAYTGRLDEAEAILLQDGALVMVDQREGVECQSDLWLYIQEQRAHLRGEAFDRKAALVPPSLDFRMA